MSADTATSTENPNRPTTAVAPTAVTVSTPIPATISDFSPEAMAQLHDHLDDTTRKGNRFVWFLTGFVAALLSVAVAGVVFLAVSDEDDDG